MIAVTLASAERAVERGRARDAGGAEGGIVGRLRRLLRMTHDDDGRRTEGVGGGGEEEGEEEGEHR
ncbi:MAG: hypothetical protein V9E87_16875 [Gemmatimonadales bacterium]